MRTRMTSRLRNVRAGFESSGRRSDMKGGNYSSGRIGKEVSYSKYLMKGAADVSKALAVATQAMTATKQRLAELSQEVRDKKKLGQQLAEGIVTNEKKVARCITSLERREKERERIQEDNKREEEEDEQNDEDDNEVDVSVGIGFVFVLEFRCEWRSFISL